MKTAANELSEETQSVARQSVEASLAGIPVAVCLAAAGRIAFANGAFLRLLGFDESTNPEAANLGGRSLAELAAGESQQALSALLEAATTRPGESASARMQLLHCVGAAIAVEATAQVLSLPHPVTQLTFAAVSESEAADPPQASREELLWQVLRSLRDCVQILDSDGRLLWMNAAGQCRLDSADFEPLAGRNWVELWSGAAREAAEAALRDALAGRDGRFEGAFRNLREEETWWDIALMPMVGREGRVERLLAVSREITDRKQMESALQSKTAQLQIIVDHVPALISYVDSEGRYQWVNRSYEDWYGLSKADAVGRPALEVLRERVGEAYAEQLRPKLQAALGGSDVTFEAAHCFEGTRHDLSLAYTPDIDESNEVRGVVVLVNDLSEQQRAQRDLKSSERRFRTLATAMPSIVWTAGATGKIDYLSERFRQITTLDPESALRSKFIHVIHPEDLAAVMPQWKAALASGDLFETQLRLQQEDGQYRWFLARALPQRNDAGEIVRWVGVATDIHHQVVVEQTIRDSERRYRLLFDDNPHPMWTYDPQTLRFTSVNKMTVQEYGYSREELLSMRLTDIRPPEDLPAMLGVLHNPPMGKRVGPVRHRRKNGSVFWAEVVVNEVESPPERILLSIAQDVSERVRLDHELIRIAQHDSLTGLPNRLPLLERFEQAVARARRSGRPFAVLAIDFDRFKQINDIFGHQIGDQFLKAVAQRLRSRLRAADTLARVGGDEFLAIAEELASSEDGLAVARNVLAALHDRVMVGELELQSSVSIGVAVYPDDGEALGELMQRADYGLYQAKRSGRSCCRRYSDPQGLGLNEAIEIERSLRVGIEQGLFELHYQPQCSRNGAVKKVEALLRLRHPELGLLAPRRFISIAEESGLITSIGLWVLREACTQTAQWRKQGRKVVPVSVNVSAIQFSSGDLAEEVRKVLEQTGMEARLLELELTESLLIENVEQSRRQLQQLKELGVRIAMDDFGTGYSSLSYLHALPLDTLKIDRSFIQRLTDGNESRSIVKAIVELGKNLGLSVVAEGVETEEQYRQLVQLDCELLQGFLFAGPEPAREFSRFLGTAE